MLNSKQQRKLGHDGFFTKKITKSDLKKITDEYTNKQNEFSQRVPRLDKTENIPLEKIMKFNEKKFALIGKSPTDSKFVSRIVYV